MYKDLPQKFVQSAYWQKLGAPGPFARQPIIPQSFGIVNRQNDKKIRQDFVYPAEFFSLPNF